MTYTEYHECTWFVYYEDEYGEKHNRGFDSPEGAQVFAVHVEEEGGIVLSSKRHM